MLAPTQDIELYPLCKFDLTTNENTEYTRIIVFP